MNVFRVTRNLSRGPRPSSQQDMDWLAMQGFTDVLSLEHGYKAWFDGNINEETEWGAEAKVNVQSIRMSDLLPPSPRALDAALRIISTARCAERSVYVHCLHGVDRTGFVIAAFRVSCDGWSWSKAHDELLFYGFHRWAYWWWIPSLKKYLGVK